ncbi:hypothetical protein [uncultured Tateyamaria sp.]|uniref:hypothetical protein n=1 Tax=Tateyamaria sp. 1078 TaxID=3417464 RepID=UPI0026146D98|nr:hypothetical protein [uncultured Tateyamaria sp.]
MGQGVNQKDLLVKIDDGTGTMVEIPYQGEAEFNTGKETQVSRTKNGAHPYQTEAGATLTFSFEKERPALTIHTRLRTLSETGELVAVEYGDKNTGGEMRSGSASVSLGAETAGTEGVISQSVSLGFVDDPVPGITA